MYNMVFLCAWGRFHEEDLVRFALNYHDDEYYTDIKRIYLKETYPVSVLIESDSRPIEDTCGNYVESA